LRPTYSDPDLEYRFLCIPARRPTRTVAGSRRGLSAACSAADIKLARSARARLPAGIVRRQLAVRARLDQHGWGRAGDCMAGAYRRVLPVSWHSPLSIPFRSRRAAARMKAWTRRPAAINLDTIAGCALLAMPRRSRRRSACAANAVLVVIPAGGAYHLVQTA